MRVLCTLPNAGKRIGGILFEPAEGGMLSEEVSDDIAIRLLSIPGYVDPGADPVAQPRRRGRPPKDKEVIDQAVIQVEQTDQG